MRELPQGEDGTGFELRRGQNQLVQWLAKNPDAEIVRVRWPTGYGKSIGMALAYKSMRERGRVDRLLVVVANNTQRDQFMRDFKADCRTIGLAITDVWGFDREPVTLLMSSKGKAEVFIINIQTVSSTNRSEIDTLMHLLRDGEHRWMLAADEFHHYGDGMDWGEALLRVRRACAFTIAMSATPDRDGVATIFGDPDLTVTYAKAVTEGAVKDMRRANYQYRVDVIDGDGLIQSFTTDDLREIAEREDISKYEHKRRLRYTPKYISPILLNPVTRLQALRMKHGVALQMLVRAMSCMHARHVCEQLEHLVGDELKVDWVGTGPNGRADEENRAILQRFCPRKDVATGERPTPGLDVLVQVGMAGEGYDTILVSEIVDLAIVSLTGESTQSKQFYGRGSRHVKVPVERGDPIVLFVNVPTDHPLSGLTKSLVAWMDDAETPPEPDGDGNDGDDGEDQDWPETDIPPLPEQPPSIHEVHLLQIRIDDPHFRAFVTKMNTSERTRDKTPFDMGNPADVESAMECYRECHQRTHAEQDLAGRYAKLREDLDKAIGQVARRVASTLSAGTFERSLIGDKKKRINSYLRATFGQRKGIDDEKLAEAWAFVRELEEMVIVGQTPGWLR